MPKVALRGWKGSTMNNNEYANCRMIGSSHQMHQGHLLHGVCEEVWSQSLEQPRIAPMLRVLRLLPQQAHSSRRFFLYYDLLFLDLALERVAGLRRLLQALDHCLYRWTSLLTAEIERTPRKALEAYFQQLLLSSINKALCSRRFGQIKIAYKELKSTRPLQRELLQSTNADTQRLCGRHSATLGSFMLELGYIEEGIHYLLSALRSYLQELQNRIRSRKYLILAHILPKDSYKIQHNVLGCELVS
jgi:hypothetical protein